MHRIKTVWKYGFTFWEYVLNKSVNGTIKKLLKIINQNFEYRTTSYTTLVVQVFILLLIHESNR